jgi:mono/diheme cytochrome c family protein
VNFVRAISRAGVVCIGATLVGCVLTGTIFAQSGEDLYNKKCAVCHAKDGSGNTAKGKKAHVKDVHQNMKDSEAAMIKVVTDGKGDDMDSYKSEFSADQIKSLVEYYRSLGK